MKTFAKIAGGAVGLMLITVVGLQFYFSGERLKQTVMPHLEEAVGRPVEVGTFSLTLFQTFPQPGIRIDRLRIPGDTPADTLLSLDEFVASVNLFSLFGDQIEVSEIRLIRPRFTYRVYADSTTNLSFLTPEEDTVAVEEDEGLALNIPRFTIRDGAFGFRESASGTLVQLDDLNADLALSYGSVIRSDLNLELGGVTAQVGEERYLNRLALSLSQSSTVDLEREEMQLEQGTFSIRGLALDLEGSVRDWSSGTPAVDLTFRSNSDNFGELLGLVPESYREQVAELETRGALALEGRINGIIGAEELPDFRAALTVSDGYLKNPDLPEAVRDIQISATVSNDSASLQQFRATAGSNTLSGSGTLLRPLSGEGGFSVALEGNWDLATVDQFYALEEIAVDRLSGQLTLNATAEGEMNQPEEARFDAELRLEDGLLKYADVPRPIENIAIDARANQDRITIRSLALEAAANRVSLSGEINGPMREQPDFNLDTELYFDLATLKEFYPIDEDTLQVRGTLSARATLRGTADRIEEAVREGSLNLENGYLSHYSLGQPIEDITLRSSLESNKISLARASFRSGGNDLSLSGSISDYLSDNPRIDLQMNGNARLAEINSYYDLRPAIDSLTGNGRLDLQISGPVQQPHLLAMRGSAVIEEMHMSGDSLGQPVRNLNGELNLTPQSVQLTGLAFDYGSSDLMLSGSLQDYREYLKNSSDRSGTPRLQGDFKSRFFNMDELIDWEDTTTVPIPIELPDLISSANAAIDTLLVTGVTMRNLKAQAGTTPEQITLNSAYVEMFDGSAEGSFIWNVPRPDRTNIRFNGTLTELNVASFFREYPVMGEKSNFHEFVTGKFSSDVTYYAELDVYLEPDIPSTEMEGTFTLSKSRLRGHPLQQRIAALLNTEELNNIALDESVNRFRIRNSVLTIENLRLTSGDIGAEMSGTRHLINDKVDYRLRIFLPGRFAGRIASVLSEQAVEALRQENGTILLPLRVTGTQASPRVQPDQDVIETILKDFLKNKAGNVLKNLFGN